MLRYSYLINQCGTLDFYSFHHHSFKYLKLQIQILLTDQQNKLHTCVYIYILSSTQKKKKTLTDLEIIKTNKIFWKMLFPALKHLKY